MLNGNGLKYTVKGTKKGTVVCIHGNSSSTEVFQTLLSSGEILNSVVAIELKGHGDNQSKDHGLSDFSFESHKQYLLDQLSDVSGDILLVGNSLGGHLAIEIAHEVENLKGLVIMGTPPVKKPINFEEAFIPVEALNTYFTENPREDEIVNAARVTVSEKTHADVIVNDFKKANPLVRKATAADITQDKLLDQFSIFKDLNVPKYILAGDVDPSVNRSYLAYVKDCSGADCEIIDLAGCGHFPSLEQPQKFIGIINDITQVVFRQ